VVFSGGSRLFNDFLVKVKLEKNGKISRYFLGKARRVWEQWRRQNFSAAGAQPGHHNLDRRGTFKNYAFLLILAQFDAGA